MSLGRAFNRRLAEKAREYDRLSRNPDTKPKMLRAPWVGTEAQEPWIAIDLKEHCGSGKRGINADPITAVSNLGDPRRTDVVATVAGEVVQFELKKSDYGGPRVFSQLAAQIFDLGLGTYGAGSLCVIYGETGRIDVYTREDAKRAVDVVLDSRHTFQVPDPAQVIDFRPKP